MLVSGAQVAGNDRKYGEFVSILRGDRFTRAPRTFAYD